MEVTIKDLKSGLHLGQMQVTNDKERVTRSVSLSVLAYLLLVCLYGREEAATKTWSLFKLKERFIGEVVPVWEGRGSHQDLEPLQAQRTLHRGSGTRGRAAY